jgi:PAS domain S-box-containing protein
VLEGQEVSEFEEIGTDSGGRAYVNLSVKFPLTDESGTPVEICGISTDITDRKRVDGELRKSETRLRLALAAANMVAWEYDPLTKHLTISENADEVLALPRGETLKDSDRGYSLIHPDDVEKHRALVRGAIENAGSYISVYRQVRDGEVFWLEERGRAVTGASGRSARLVGVTHNISAGKQAEEVLAAAKQRLDAHMDNSPLAVIEFDPEFRVIRWSREAERVFGWTAREVTGRAIAELRWVYEDDVETVRQVSADMLEGRRPRNVSVNRNYCKDGSVVRCEWYNSAIYDSDGRLTSILFQILDITERQKAEAALQQANAALAEADRRKDEFTAVLSHELRNPLAPIRYALPLLGEERLGEAGRRATAVIDRQVAHLVRLVDDLLDISRITTGKHLTKPADPQQIHRILADVAERVSSSRAARTD